MTVLELQYLVDPVAECGDARVDAGLVGLRAADAPRDDAAQYEARVSLALYYHWPTAVSYVTGKVSKWANRDLPFITN